MSELVLTSRRDGILVVTVNNPPVNALSPGVLEGIVDGIRAANADASIQAIVVIGGGRTFIAGADIREFPKIISGERPKLSLNPLLREIEDSPKPVVMAIHGTALGGGLETAMAGHYRIAAPTAQVGQPEVKLALIPGAGGTQRLPRLCGVEYALRLCVFGEPVGAADALAHGIVDRIAEGDLLEDAITYALSFTRPRRTRDLPVAPALPEAIEAIRTEARRKLRGQRAPEAALDAVSSAASLSFDDGLEKERALFEECLGGSQARALIHVFFGEREVAKIPFLSKDIQPRPVRSAAVAGAGTMGRGIAMAFANAGIPVRLMDRGHAELEHALESIGKLYERSVKNGRFSREDADARLERISTALSYDGFENADVIVEAVYENLDAKLAVFRDLDRVAHERATLATNTSTLDIDKIAAATRRPENVLGLHFFSPANVMKLLEVVRGGSTSDETIATGMELGRKLKKIPVLAGNCFGFIGNRMFAPYREAAIACAEEGALPWQVDRALEEWGMAMGPLAVGDLAGLDIGWAIRREAGLGTNFEDVLHRHGRYGQKTRAGWYLYDEKGVRQPDHAVETMLREYAAEEGVPQRKFTDAEIVDRCITALRDEGGRILDEGIALRAADVDIVYVHGYGYPAWRGGPMFGA